MSWPTISIPLLAVFGQTIEAATRQHLLAHLPSAEIEEWVGRGHMVHLIEPDRFSARLVEFTSKLVPSERTATS